MREHSMPGEVIRLAEDVIRLDGDVIRLDGVTKTYQAGALPALAEVSMSVSGAARWWPSWARRAAASPRCST